MARRQGGLMTASVFFGYPARPTQQAEVMRTVAEGLKNTGGANATTWEDLVVDGQIVIAKVLNAIDDASMSIFDITIPNQNVLFEAGYATGRGKPICLAMDTTDRRSKSSWRNFALLRDVGYTAYRNSDDLISYFETYDPVGTLTPLYDQIVEPALPGAETRRDQILYCTTFEPFEAANRLNNLIETRQARGEKIVVADPSEASLTTLTWFISQIGAAAGVLVNFAGRERNRSKIFNNRHAFIAGLARGLETPILLLSEDTYDAPFDYENLMRVYETAEECLQEAREWLGSLEVDRPKWNTPRDSLRSRLAGWRFGEHVAENERTELRDYFVETSAYHEVIASRDSIFIGHRGNGKTANAIQAFEHLAADKRNLAILIKPPGFEFSAMLAVVERLPAFQHDYFFDALWRFVIQTEIANAVLHRIEQRKFVPPGQEEQALIDYVEQAQFDIRSDMSVRLEQALDSLRDALADQTDDSKRNLINEAFHTHALARLRSRLGTALKDRHRVAVFVDNLDKGWEKKTNFSVMADFILGLLTARGQVVKDFEKEDYWRERIKLTVAIFLRSDIYAYLRDAAREPDKLPLSTVSWKDSATLRNVLESRFFLAVSDASSPKELWSEYFCKQVDGYPAEDYIHQSILPRPRDLVYLCNAALARAVDRGHQRVEAEDFRSARDTYSQYAYEALLVENGVTVPEMEEVLLSFIGASSTATYAERTAAVIKYGGFTSEQVPPLISKLISMSFFGVEVATDEFVFPEIGTEMKVALARALRLQPEQSGQRLRIHAAFEPFLGIEATPWRPR
jgi:hypothetical protein